MVKRFLAVSLVVTLSMAFSACSSISYYSQSVGGQLELFFKQEDITDLLHDDTLSAELKQRLRLVLEIRDFSIHALALPENDSYRSYADLKRSHVVWNVFAAPEFSTELKKWCFPFAGCVGYKGYFDENDARETAVELRAEGLDVHIGGVDAYSTLGWFDDPVLNTVIQRSEPHLAGLIFHELAHQQLYVKGDTAFNESFASSVELEGVKRWLQHKKLDHMMDEYETYRARRLQFIALVNATRTALADIYTGADSDEEKRQRKAETIAELHRHYAELKQQWQGYSGYDRWFDGEINNAKIASVAVYTDWVPAFQAMLASVDYDFKAFYAKVRALADMEKPERESALKKLAAAAKTFAASNRRR